MISFRSCKLSHFYCWLKGNQEKSRSDLASRSGIRLAWRFKTVPILDLKTITTN